jgi:hypothetical protein
MPESEFRFREMQEFQGSKVRRRIVFLQDAAASAARVSPIDFTASFDQHGASARGIGAMPAFPRFHHHGQVPPFARAAGMSANTAKGRRMNITRFNVSIGKYKSKLLLELQRKTPRLFLAPIENIL